VDKCLSKISYWKLNIDRSQQNLLDFVPFLEFSRPIHWVNKLHSYFLSWFPQNFLYFEFNQTARFSRWSYFVQFSVSLYVEPINRHSLSKQWVFNMVLFNMISQFFYLSLVLMIGIIESLIGKVRMKFIKVFEKFQLLA